MGSGGHVNFEDNLDTVSTSKEKDQHGEALSKLKMTSARSK